MEKLFHAVVLLISLIIGCVYANVTGYERGLAECSKSIETE